MSFQPAASYTIRLLAPSGYPHDPDAINRALERLSTAQQRIENIEATQRRFQRFGGTDGERAGDLNRLAPKPGMVKAGATYHLKLTGAARFFSP